MKQNLAGPSEMARGGGVLVAIKVVKASKDSVLERPSYTSEHIVKIVDAYRDDSKIIFFYEAMEVSLRQITGVIRLEASEIAAVCKDVKFCVPVDMNAYIHLHRGLGSGWPWSCPSRTFHCLWHA